MAGEGRSIDSSSAAADSSRLAHPARAPTETTIPSFGPEFFEYRRRLFLAGLPLPIPPPTSGPLPESYTVPLPFPDPVPAPPNSPSPNSSVGKLEALLQEEGAEETMAAWSAGLAGVHARLEGGKRLSKPIKLGLVIKVLKAGWIRDGTWPMDVKTRRAAIPPSSPTIPGIPESSRRTSSIPLVPATAGAGPSHRPATPVPDLSTLPPVVGTLTLDHGHSAIPLPPRSSSLVDRRKQHDSQRDVRVGADVWRGAKQDPAVDRGASIADHG